MTEASAATVIAMLALAFIGLLSCGVGVLELRLWFRPWALIGATKGPQPTLLGAILWLLVGGLILYVVGAIWFKGIPT
jgi:hypothetical protein